MKKFKAIAGTFFIAVVALIGWGVHIKQSSHRDVEVERAFGQLIHSAAQGRPFYLDFDKIGWGREGEICFQKAYITKEKFEEMTGKNVHGFEYPPGHQFENWWIFSPSNEARWFWVYGAVEDPKGMRVGCAHLSKIKIKMVCGSGCVYKVEGI
jgi:hypothetical protein